ncbi:MAG: c-type cytochrome [Anaerolineales bacterium]|nr:c-type cytochrome [Anaerolineales bacterium]
MKSIRLIFFALPLILSACSFSFTCDVTPPPGAESIAIVPAQADRTTTNIYPLVPPDPVSGKTIYAEKCASCHGTSGKGDGERANQLPNPVTALGDLEIIRQATPSNWFVTIKNGNLERYMPPFPSLSDRQIWDTVAYLYQINVDSSYLAAGKQSFEQKCSRCHGDQAKGDGVDAADFSTQPTNLADLAFISGKSSIDLFQSITYGKIPDMPSFGSSISDETRWAIIDYLRNLTFASSQATIPTPSEMVTTPTITATQIAPGSPITTTEIGVVDGRVINGTDDDPVSGLMITLYGFDNNTPVISETTTTRSDGYFIFHDIEMVEGRVFLATAEFEKTSYSSDVSVVLPEANSLNLPITVYKTTTDTSIIKVDRLHLFFEMLDEQTVRVVELYVMSNPSNLTLVPAGEGVTTIKFKLPVGSKNLQFQDSVLGERYLETPDGFGDTYGVRPGSGSYQVVFAFEMPYNRKMELVQPMLLPVDAVVVLAPEGTIRIRSDILQDEGTRTMENNRYHVYSGSSIKVGQDLNLTITGSLAGSPSISLGSNPELVVGVGVFGLSVAVVGVWWYWKNQRKRMIEKTRKFGTTLESTESVMDAILALDDLFQNGELPEEAYHQRRTQLKDRLRTLLEDAGNKQNL